MMLSKRLQVSIKFLILFIGWGIHLEAASKEDAEKGPLLATSAKPMDQTDVERILADDNVYYNIQALRALKIIGDTGRLEEDLKAFPYLVKLVSGQGARRDRDEIIKMDLSPEGERASRTLYGIGKDVLDKKEFGLAMHYLLLSELTGHEIAGFVLQEIFKNPGKKGLDHLFKASKILADIYACREIGFSTLRAWQYGYIPRRESRASADSHSSGSTASARSSDSGDAGSGGSEGTTAGLKQGATPA